MADRIDDYLAELGRALRVENVLKKRIIDEVASHLREGVQEYTARGIAAEEAARRVIERFGTPEAVAALWAEVYTEGSGGGGMGVKYTERARHVIYYAQEEAARLGTRQVGTAHLLLGLMRDDESVAARLLERLGIARGRIRAGVDRFLTRGSDYKRGDLMELTPRTKEAIDLACEESRALASETISTEHLLLGLLRQAEGRRQIEQSAPLIGQGILEIVAEGWGFLRRFSDLAPAPNDIYVSPGQIERFALQAGDWISGRVRPPGELEKYYGLTHIETVNGRPPSPTASWGAEDIAGNVLLVLGLDGQHARAALAGLPGEM